MKEILMTVARFFKMMDDASGMGIDRNSHFNLDMHYMV